MAIQTLEELKALNAAEEAAKESTETVETEEVEESTEDDAEETTEDKAEDAEKSDTEEESDEETEEESGEVEPWQQSEEQDSHDDQPREFTAADVARARRKERAKAQRKTEDEVAQLRAELDALKSGRRPPPAQPQKLPPRPTLEQFGYDEEKYTEALDKWHDARLDQRLTAHSTSQQQAQLQESQQRAMQDAINAHDARAAALVAQNRFSAQAFAGADVKVREALDQVLPGNGDTVTDQLIAQLGEGSEKLIYFLGNNADALSALQGKLAADPNGLTAMLYLGELKARKVDGTLAKPKSKTPPPGKRLKGDVSGTGKAGALKKRYDAAEGDPQARVSLKRLAKRSGLDTSNW